MFPHFKGNGGLIILYLIASIILISLAARFLNEHNVQVDDYLVLSLTFLCAAICTYFTKDIFIKDKEGNKIKVDFKSSLLFIEMKYWVYILSGVALLLFLKHLSN